MLTDHLEKAFLQVRIKETERDVLKFHWKSPESDDMVVYRFTRALFGLTFSPFVLSGVLSFHLKSWETKYPQLVEEIRKNLYVDDLMTGGTSITEVEEKNQATEIFEDATFKLHKWHSSVRELEGPTINDKSEASSAKQELGDEKLQTKLLGLSWDKSKDGLSVALDQEDNRTTKRSLLPQLGRIHDPLGLVSPMTLQGKSLFREACQARVSWNGKLPEIKELRWDEWCDGLPKCYEIPRFVAPHQEPVSAITLHAFGNASKLGVSAVVYTVIDQKHGTTQGLVCSKSRLPKRSLSLPRLELVAGHMAVSLITNVGNAKPIIFSLLVGLHRNALLDKRTWRISTVAKGPIRIATKASHRNNARSRRREKTFEKSTSIDDT